MKEKIKRVIEFLKHRELEKKMSFSDFLDYEIDNNIDFSDLDSYDGFGLRYHQGGIAIGDDVPNSFEIHRGDFGEEDSYVEMSSVSTIGISVDTDIEKILKHVGEYMEFDRELILVAGNDWGEGLDHGELEIAYAKRIF